MTERVSDLQFMPRGHKDCAASLLLPLFPDGGEDGGEAVGDDEGGTAVEQIPGHDYHLTDVFGNKVAKVLA